MGAPSSPWRLRMFELLADGEWHEREQVVRECARLVPPGRAFRTAEKNRTRFNEGERVRPADPSDLIASGQRAMASQSLNNAIRNGDVEAGLENGVRMLRLTHKTRTNVAAKGSDVDPILDELEVQLVFWNRAYNMMGSNADVRNAILGDDPRARLVAVLEQHGRTVT